MSFIVPSVSDFKSYFFRDFPYGSTLATVQDADISKAIDEAAFNFNQALFSTQAKFTMGYLYLTAHYLVMDLRASSQGIAGSYSWLVNSKSVANVSEAYTIPQYILDHPLLGMYSKTNYGAEYISLILPQLVGQTFVVCGVTKP